jgi:signal transduction histidine kinase
VKQLVEPPAGPAVSRHSGQVYDDNMTPPGGVMSRRAPDPAAIAEVEAERPVGRAARRPFERWKWGLAIFLSWNAYGVFSAQQTILYLHAIDAPAPPMRQILPLGLTTAWIWAAFTPVVIWLAHRLRIGRSNWLWRVPVHLVVALSLCVIDVSIDRAVYPLVGIGQLPFDAMLLFQLDVNVFSYFVVLAVTHAVNYYRWFRERQYRASELSHDLATAELQLLKMQLQPHFLFNTLNAISELIHENPEAADRTITRLGSLLRMSLDQAGSQEITLKQELEFLRAYVEIEQTRFRDRLSVDVQVEPQTLDACVPTFVLQPLVENSIRHGLSPRAGPGRVGIFALARDGRLQLEVRDNGVGLRRGEIVEGVGISNTRARLQQLYGDAHRFNLAADDDGGVVVSIEFPLRIALAAENGASAENRIR